MGAMEVMERAVVAK